MHRISRKKAVRAATLADVGRMAGVSAMAASAVLNGARTSSRISAETRARIIEAANKLRYRPNVAARALANRRMNTVGVAAVVDDGVLNYYFLEVLNGIIEAAARHQQNTTVFALHDWTHDISKIAGFCDGRIDGLILLGPVISPENAAFLPEHTHFTALHPNLLLPNFTSIESDEEKGAYEMVRHLVSQGHKRILHLSGVVNLLGAERRISGYRLALAEAGISVDPDLMIPAGYSVAGGRLAMEAWLDRHVGKPLPTAIFCANDSSAIGCIETLSSRGIRVPTDVSLCGFDDSIAARSCVPQLTTVRQPLWEMGIQAVESLLEHIQYSSGQLPADKLRTHIVFPTELKLRDSVAAPSATKLVPAR